MPIDYVNRYPKKKAKKYRFIKVIRNVGIDVYYREDEKDITALESMLSNLYPGAKFEYGTTEIS